MKGSINQLIGITLVPPPPFFFRYSSRLEPRVPEDLKGNESSDMSEEEEQEI